MRTTPEIIDESLDTIRIFKSTCSNEIDVMAEKILTTLKKGGKLFVCGNGGSAADAQHFAAEIVSSFSLGLKRQSLPALALTVDTSVITAIANDFGFEMIFARQIDGLATSADSLLAISTSGESLNCIKAVEAAQRKGLQTLALTKSNSTLSHIVDFAIKVPSLNTQHIQTCHQISYHIISEKIDSSYSTEKYE